VHASIVRIKRHVKASSQRRARHDKTVLSVSRPLRRRVGGFPTTQDCRRRKISEVRTRSQQSSDSQRHTTPDTTQTARSCRVWCRADFSPVLTNPRRLHTHPTRPRTDSDPSPQKLRSIPTGPRIFLSTKGGNNSHHSGSNENTPQRSLNFKL